MSHQQSNSKNKSSQGETYSWSTQFPTKIFCFLQQRTRTQWGSCAHTYTPFPTPKMPHLFLRHKAKPAFSKIQCTDDSIICSSFSNQRLYYKKKEFIVIGSISQTQIRPKHCSSIWTTRKKTTSNAKYIESKVYKFRYIIVCYRVYSKIIYKKNTKTRDNIRVAFEIIILINPGTLDQ